MTDEIRFARVALSYLVEPGNRALWTRVAEHGPVRVLSGLCEQGGDRLRELAGARLATGDPRATAEETLRRTHRLGARVVVPEDDEWPHQLDRIDHRSAPRAATDRPRRGAAAVPVGARSLAGGRGAGAVGGRGRARGRPPPTGSTSLVGWGTSSPSGSGAWSPAARTAWTPTRTGAPSRRPE